MLPSTVDFLLTATAYVGAGSSLDLGATVEAIKLEIQSGSSDVIKVTKVPTPTRSPRGSESLEPNAKRARGADNVVQGIIEDAMTKNRKACHSRLNRSILKVLAEYIHGIQKGPGRDISSDVICSALQSFQYPGLGTSKGCLVYVGIQGGPGIEHRSVGAGREALCTRLPQWGYYLHGGLKISEDPKVKPGSRMKYEDIISAPIFRNILGKVTGDPSSGTLAISVGEISVGGYQENVDRPTKLGTGELRSFNLSIGDMGLIPTSDMETTPIKPFSVDYADGKCFISYKEHDERARVEKSIEDMVRSSKLELVVLETLSNDDAAGVWGWLTGNSELREALKKLGADFRLPDSEEYSEEFINIKALMNNVEGQAICRIPITAETVNNIGIEG